ncbi:RDD family protein [Candidatus Bandiella euplotis]|uniref:RDD family protein N-terminal domain protein n=1 Tax=Candidatus Bandiella euplotis TaxID=1664265 RepID=A0ABZ0UQZ9_9RICK|nr:RDD family protein N-terminal domain protein [Candidatus Bandiella woodruffii]
MTKINYIYATFERKIIAFGIDVILITIILFPISNLLTILFFGPENTPVVEATQSLSQAKNIDFWMFISTMFKVAGSTKNLIIQFILLVCVLTYFMSFWVKMGASVGKLIMRCKIVDADTYQAITTKQAVKRMLGHFLKGVLP